MINAFIRRGGSVLQTSEIRLLDRRVLKWELVGMAVIFVVGSALHFLFTLTHHWRPIAWFAAVNESTWEHLKLAFWPGLLFALIEYINIGKRYRSFWLAKWLALLLITTLIPLFFYGYVAVLGSHNMVLDLLIFLLAILIGQAVSFLVITKTEFHRALHWLGIIGLLAMAFTFSVLSYYPPRSFLFRCPQTQQYGIPTD
jgi:hypothetical protein